MPAFSRPATGSGRGPASCSHLPPLGTGGFPLSDLTLVAWSGSLDSEVLDGASATHAACDLEAERVECRA